MKLKNIVPRSGDKITMADSLKDWIIGKMKTSKGNDYVQLGRLFDLVILAETVSSLQGSNPETIIELRGFLNRE